MANPSVEFHFDFGSPNAYLSHLVIPGIEARTGVDFKFYDIAPLPQLLDALATDPDAPVRRKLAQLLRPTYLPTSTRLAALLKRHPGAAAELLRAGMKDGALDVDEVRNLVAELAGEDAVEKADAAVAAYVATAQAGETEAAPAVPVGAA